MNLTILVNIDRHLSIELGEYFTNVYQRFNIIPDKDEIITVDPGSHIRAGIFKVNTKAYTVGSNGDLLVKLILTKIQ